MKFVTLGDFAETTSGATPPRGNKDFWHPAEIPWVKTAEVAFKPITDTEERISKAALEKCSVKLLPPKTILIAMYGQGKTRGQSAILNIQATINQACFAILPNDTWEPEFLQLWLKANYQKLRDLSDGRGGNQANLNCELLNALKVPAPILDSQRQIAARLKAQLAEVETARHAAQVQLSDARLLRARMLKAFFAELDTTPKKRLGEHAPTTSGSTPSRGNKQYWQPAEIAWVKTGEVAFVPITATEEAISKLALAECSLTLLPPKTILIAMYGQGKTRGQSAILEILATTNQACFAILPNETWEPDFLYLWFKASYQDLREMSEDRGGNQANLNGALLKALDIPAPTKTEQTKLVARIQAAMTELDAMEQSSKEALADIEKLPARILAQAFEN